MQRTTAQSQQESQKTRARLVLFWKPFYRMRAFNVARPRQRNIYQITSPTHVICMHTDKQANFIWTAFSSRLLYFRSNSQFTSTTLFGGELVGGVMVSWWRVGWWRKPLVARWPDTVTRDRDNKAQTHTHTILICLPFSRKSKDVEIKRCEDCSSRNLTYKFCTCTH